MCTFLDLTPENLPSEHLCCIIRTRKPHPGVEAKRQWLSDQSFARKFGFQTVNLLDEFQLRKILTP